MHNLPLIWAVNLAFDALILLVFARVIISWLPAHRYHPVVMWITRVTEPMLKPFRMIVKTGSMGIDLAPMILLVVLYVARRIVVSMLLGVSLP